MHHPPHIYLDDTWYMVTAATREKRPLLRPRGHKEIVRDHLQAMVADYGLQLAAWVTLDNHYHLLVKSRAGAELARFFQRLHGRTSFDLNGLEHARGRQVWHNYWDTCIRAEADYWTRFNYVHHNPVKHGYVVRTADWPHSSYHHYVEHKGEDWLEDAFQQYPVLDFTDPEDDF